MLRSGISLPKVGGKFWSCFLAAFRGKGVCIASRKTPVSEDGPPKNEVPKLRYKALHLFTILYHRLKYTTDLTHSPQEIKPLKKYNVKINLCT